VVVLLLYCCVVVVLALFSSSCDGTKVVPFPDYCSFEWYAYLNVSGTLAGTPFGPEPAKEWSSYTTQNFRYELPDHDVFSPSLKVGEGGVITTIDGYPIWYVYTSYCCYTMGPDTYEHYGGCEAWFSCNILAMGELNTACIVKSGDSWNYQGQTTINGVTVEHWHMQLGTYEQNFYADATTFVPILYQWNSSSIEMTEYLYFEQFEKQSSPFPPSTFSISDITNICNSPIMYPCVY